MDTKTAMHAEVFAIGNLVDLRRAESLSGARHRPTTRLNGKRIVRLARSTQVLVATAVVYCEGKFGTMDGKTANGLVRHSEKYTILSVIDSRNAGLDAGMVLGEEANAIPVCRDLAEALACAGAVPDYFILGVAPSTGMLSARERGIVLEAMSLGMNVVNGLHELLNDDPELAAASAANNVEIIDVRRARA